MFRTMEETPVYGGGSAIWLAHILVDQETELAPPEETK